MDRGSPARPHHGQAAYRGSQPMTLLGGGLKAEPFSQDTGSRTPGQPGQNFLGNAPPSETPCPPPPQRSAPHHGPRALTLFSSLHPSSFTGVSPSNPLAHLIPSWPLLLGGSEHTWHSRRMPFPSPLFLCDATAWDFLPGLRRGVGSVDESIT